MSGVETFARIAAVMLALAWLVEAAGLGSAEAPSGHFVRTGSSVADTATRLVWQAETPDGTFSWSDAGAYCEALDLDGKGWRLPSVKELLSLVDENAAMPASDPVFPNTALDYYWTSTPVVGLAGNAWGVSFAFGFDGLLDVGSREHVRCVR